MYTALLRLSEDCTPVYLEDSIRWILLPMHCSADTSDEDSNPLRHLISRDFLELDLQVSLQSHAAMCKWWRLHMTIRTCEMIETALHHNCTLLF